MAALDASVSERHEADYVCDGVADEVEIIAAITALPSTGGSVVLSTGTFTLAAQVLKAKDNVHIYGQGRNTLLNLDGSTAVITAGTRTGWLIENLRTDGGTVDVASATTSAKIFIWEGATFISQVLAGGTIAGPLTISGASAIVPASAGVGDIGSATLPFDDVYVDTAFHVTTTADANDKAKLSSDRLEFGPGGGTALDTILVRNAAGVIDIRHATTPVFNLRVTGDANPKAVIDATSISFGAGGASAVDTVLTRSAADTWTSTDKWAHTPSSTQSITAVSNTILANARVVMVSANAEYAMSAVPQIADGIDGQLLTIINVGVNRITLQGDAGGSNIKLGFDGDSARYTLQQYATLELMFSSTIGAWIQLNVGHPDVVQLRDDANASSVSILSGGSVKPIKFLGTGSGVSVSGSGYINVTETALVLANGSNDNLALGTTRSSHVRITGPTGIFNITGFVAPTAAADGFTGQHLWIYNSTAQSMTITHDAISTAANRIFTRTGVDVTLAGRGTVELYYSAADTRWILTGTS